ncbi:MAG: GNAT family N-acetyltransferase [Bacillota bacterium]
MLGNPENVILQTILVPTSYVRLTNAAIFYERLRISMIVRDMIKEDIPQLAQLYKQFWGEDSSIDTMYIQFKKFQGNGSHILLSAVEDNQLVGSVMGVICEELYGDCKSFLVLENMIVDKEHRNRGIGRALISELERRAAEKCNQIILVTEANRIDACSFYESVGYRPEAYKGFKKKLK